MLGIFWVADDTAQEIRAVELESWLDTLGDMTCNQFRDAWVAYQRTGPRTAKGRLYKPDAGAIWNLANPSHNAPVVIDIPAMWAAKIIDGSFVSQVAMTESMQAEMIWRKLVTREQLRSRGIR